MKRPVGRVAVDNHGRVPLFDATNESPNFGAFEFDEIAIEVESLGIGADTHPFFRPQLARPVRSRHAFITVRIEDGDDQQDQIFQQGRVGRGGNFPSEHQHCFLGVDLARMDISLNVDDKLAAF